MTKINQNSYLIDHLIIKDSPFLAWDDEISYQLYEQEDRINKDVSLKYFNNLIGDTIKARDSKKGAFSKNEYEAVISQIVQSKLIEFEVLYDIFGAKLDASHLKLGIYAIYNYSREKSQLTDKSVHFDAQFTKMHVGRAINAETGDNLLVSIKVKAKDKWKAMEQGDFLISRFENIMAFVGGDLQGRRAIDVLNYIRDDKIIRYLLHDGNSTLSLNRSVRLEVDFNDDHLICQKCGNKRIWEITALKEPNEIEKRILNAIEWVGKGIRDKDRSKSLIQFTFAIEGLLQYQVDTIITPSIMSQLADTAAFSLSEGLDDRTSIAKETRRIYKERSSVAHGSNSKVDGDIVRKSFKLSSQLIRVFLSKAPFHEMESSVSLKNYIERLKFQ